MITLQQVELGVLGPLQVRQYGLPVTIPGAKPRAILTMLGLHGGSVVSADALVELLWGADPPRTAAKALQTHISSLRRTLGDGFVLTEGTGWTLSTTESDATRYKVAARLGRDAFATGDASQAVAHFDEALTLWRGIPELPDGSRGTSEKTRWIEGHAALVEDRADALLATGRAAEIVGELEAAIADAPLRERRWGQLMLALYRAGRQGEALGAYKRARSLLAAELGVDPGPDLRRLEAAIVVQDAALEVPVSQHLSAVTHAVTFLLTDIEGSTAAWEADADAMAVALARHDEIVEQVVTSRGGRLIKTRGEGDATFSVFDRPSAAAAAAIELQGAIRHEPWALQEPMRIRVALHTGEVEFRDGDYFGRAVNRAARLRSLAAGGQILCSGATAELVIDSLSDEVILADLGMRQLRNLARPEHVFELRLETADDSRAPTTEAPMERPGLPAVLAGPGPFVGRGRELEQLLSAWQTTLDAGTRAVLIAGEPGVGKTRLAGEWSRQAYEQGAVVVYGRCDEDLGAPYQPFAEALRSLVPCLGTSRLRGLRGVEAVLPLVPGLTDALPDLAAPPRADADTERYALFDAVVALLGVASTSAPVVLILDDLHWAAKPTLLLLRHLLRFGEHARVQIVGTYRSTDLDRSHPLAAMLADLHRDGSANRLALSGLDEDDVTAYVAEAGYDDEELARALASVTGGNPFFLIEALRHVDESGGRWDPSTLPQGVREAVSRRLSRLPAETNKALAAAAVVGSRFALDLVERVVDGDLVDAFDEACKAGIVIEEPGGRYRFNHAIVRQSLLAELPSVRRMRLHQRIATTLETEPGANDELVAELAYHYFECAWAGNAAKAVEYCRRAADQAMARLAYEGAADLYDKALHALDELDDELPDRDEQQAELLVARCEALLAAGDVVSAAGAVSQLQAAASDSARLAAWGTCFDGQLSMLTDPERLDEIESAVGAAAEKLAGLDDAAGEAKAHTVRATCLGRLGRIGDAETALDQALTAARRAGEHRRVNGVLANAPLAALWGPNPVPRAGGRCLDVVRLLRITTGSPVVEATSTRCQGVLDAFRGRAAAGRQLIDSARRSLTELGMRHALLEVDQFAGIVELVADDPASAEPLLRRAYNGFRRMGLDADTAETAALLARACLALDRDADADELCSESERLAGHALKASIAWRTVRAQLLARGDAHDEAQRVAEEAVTIAGRTDALVDHGDACLALATVLKAAGDAAGAQAAAERAIGLYEQKGAAALADKARGLLVSASPAATVPPELPAVELDNACVRVTDRLAAAVDREAWDEVEQLVSPDVSVESRRNIVGFPRRIFSPRGWASEVKRFHEIGMARYRIVAIAVRGDRLALSRMEVGTSDESPGAPQDELLQINGIDEEGRIALQVWFDVEDMDAAIAELDATHARFEARHPRASLENAASRADARFNEFFAERRWDEISEMLTEDVRIEDRRRGLRREGHGRATLLAEGQAIADLGVKNMTSQVLAIRGERLALVRTLYSGRDTRPDAFHSEIVRIAEIDADERIAAYVVFDLDDLDAAFEELDARYLAGEAAPYTLSWQTLLDTLDELNCHEMGPSLEGLSYVDHRRIPFAPGDYGRAIEDLWELVPDARYWATAVHVLDARGTVVTLAIEGTDTHGNELQWARICSWVYDEARVEVYEEDDLDAALARFEELRPQERRLENAASQAYERFWTCCVARDFAAIAEISADDISTDDRRRVVNAGLRQGRDAVIAEVSALADVGVTNVTSDVIATRGRRLVLSRVRLSIRDRGPEAFHTEVLAVVAVDSAERMVAVVMFDLDDIDAAFEELDARYLAGESAAHAHTWSVMAKAFAASNRREMPEFMPDFVNIDHRRARAFAPGDLTAYMRATWNLAPDVIAYAEAVHQLSNLGAVFTQAVSGTSQDGFEAEWREIVLATVDGNLINRIELFEEADIDAALTRFEQLSRPTPRLENAASQVAKRFGACFAARDWAVMREILADDTSNDDRRRVINAGFRQGRDAEIENMRAVADTGAKNLTSTVLATRGERLALSRFLLSGRDQRPEAFRTELLGVFEIEPDNRIAARVWFDLDDIDAAFEELDARYLAGEAAAHSHTWSVIMEAYAALNRHELAATTPDWVNIDRRRLAMIGAGELTANIRASWDQTPDACNRIEAVHRLNNLGAVLTRAAYGTSQEGFDAEWREVDLVTLKSELINHYEKFDEADIDAALARFDELSRPAPWLENAASQATERFLASFAARDWAAMAQTLAEDTCTDDRRRVVGAGVIHGRDNDVAAMRASADIGVTNITPTVIATRGERLALGRARFSGRDQGPEAFHIELLGIVEINADNQIAARVFFDLDDIDAAFVELDARYLAGEAAVHSNTWSVVTQGYAALNRRELPPTTPDLVSIDHRRGATAFAPGDLTAYIQAIFDLPDIGTYVEAVHRLTDLGAVVTHVGTATSQDGFGAEWRMIIVATVEGDLINRSEFFDEDGLDAAIERFDELSLPVLRLENAASQVCERFRASFAARDWVAMTEMLADDVSNEDRRRVVNTGIRHGRVAEIEDLRASADIGVTYLTAVVVATRGERLVLIRGDAGNDERPDALQWDVLQIAEIDADERIAAIVTFDLDNIEAAFEELDARYLAGEAATHAQTWSLVTDGYAALNRHEIPPTRPEWVNIDHRRGIAFAPGDMEQYILATFDVAPDINVHPEAVHRLTDHGAVVTHAAYGTSREGFEAEWREIVIVMFVGELLERSEMFDETDLDAALARFEELRAQTPRLENAASQVAERFWSYFATRDWAAMAKILADDICTDDRRRVVSAGIRRGRDAEIADMRATADTGTTSGTLTVIATRGQRLALSRILLSGRDQRPDAFHTEALGIAEINTDGRMLAYVAFDPDDIDAAFDELDTRYLGGEAAAHSRTWSVISKAYAALNRRELPEFTPNLLDHRPLVALEAGDPTANIRAMWDFTPDLRIYVEAVHRLDELGAVVTQAVYATSQQGFGAEWRGVNILTVDGDLISRCEVFDEADIDAALARFEELHPQTQTLENAASRAYERLWTYFAARDWAAMAATIAEDIFDDDRRRVVSAGLRRGRDAEMANMRATADLGVANVTSDVIATRGERLALSRVRFLGRNQLPEAFHTEVLGIVDIDADERIAAALMFDLDDVDAAFAELDARYLAGEAAPHAHTWSVVTQAYAAINRRELFATTPDWINSDHRRAIAFEPGELISWIRASWDIAPDINIHIEAVHRLTNSGAVVTHTANANTQEGFNAEWRVITLFTIEGELIDRIELYDEQDLETALARFDELSRPAPRLENAASQVAERFNACFAARDWDAMADPLAVDHFSDDRRRVVNAGIRHGRDAEIADMRAVADVGVTNATSVVIATRGQRLALSRSRFTGRDQDPQAFQTEILDIVEIDAANRIAARITFDLDDIDAAFDELDARYTAGEAAAHSRSWSAIARAHAAFNRRELPEFTPNLLDHRPLVALEAGDPTANIRAMWDFTPDLRIYIEAVHRLSDLGAVFTQASHGTSRAGFDAEWRIVELVTVDGDVVNRGELFDEADIDAALARFEELHPQTRRLGNAASQVAERYWTHFAASDLTAMADTLAADISVDDRRRVANAGIRHGRDAHIEDVRAGADVGFTNVTSAVIATRGAHLALTHARYSIRDQRPEAFHTEALHVGEIDAEGRFAAVVVFDPEDIDAAFAELDARYLAGEAGAHAHTWSIIIRNTAAFNRRELPAATPDWVNIDHRRGTAFAPGDVIPYIHAAWDLAPDINIYIEAVHRLGDLGAVVTYAANGTSADGFDAEWREITMLLYEGNLISRFEIFDQRDLDAALAKFDEFSRTAPRLENAASRVVERYLAHFADGEWDAMGKMLADDFSTDDCRRVVNAGVRHGRDAEIANLRAITDIGTENITSTVIATRGERLVLSSTSFSVRDWPGEFHNATVDVVEIKADNQISAHVLFDPDDIDAAFAELDARYVAGEAARYARTWSVIAGVYAALNRHELPAMTADCVHIDHRPLVTIEADDTAAHIRAFLDQMPNLTIYIEAVHRLTDLGAVITHAAHGLSQEGFDAEWRMVFIYTVENDLISRSEMFDEADLDIALARFDELGASTRQLENAAIRARARGADAYNRRDVEGFLALAGGRYEDRRKGLRDAGAADRKYAHAVLSETPTSWRLEIEPVAIRGDHLALTRETFRDAAETKRPITVELITLTELADNELVSYTVFFDPDDISGAMAELTARWIASGEVAHPEVIRAGRWLVEAYNSHDWDGLAERSDGATYVNHRQLGIGGTGTMTDYMSSIRTMASLVPDLWIEPTEIVSYSAVGFVAQGIWKGTSTDGVEIELPQVMLTLLDGDRFTRIEVFDPDQRDLALARFEALSTSG